jgi:hypothetical protein
MLKTPGWAPLVESGTGRDVESVTKLSNYRQNWWCAWKPPAGAKDDEYTGYDYESGAKVRGSLKPLYPEESDPSPEFLGAADRTRAAEEWKALEATGVAVVPLGDAVLSFAKSRPDDPRAPEALHYVVRITRYGCSAKTAVNYSKVAFELLHSRYPTNEWTKKTPFWY